MLGNISRRTTRYGEWDDLDRSGNEKRYNCNIWDLYLVSNLRSKVAEVLETKDTTVCKFENGSRSPNAKQIVALCKMYGVSADYLLGLSDERQDGSSISE